MCNFVTGCGVSIGIILSGFIVVNDSWRVICWVGPSMLGILIILIIFTFPETAYNRSYNNLERDDIYQNKRNSYRLSLSIILNDAEKARVAKYYKRNDSLAEEAHRTKARSYSAWRNVLVGSKLSYWARNSTPIVIRSSYEEIFLEQTFSVFGGNLYKRISLDNVYPAFWFDLATTSLLGNPCHVSYHLL